MMYIPAGFLWGLFRSVVEIADYLMISGVYVFHKIPYHVIT
jgi:hypothetical protein